MAQFSYIHGQAEGMMNVASREIHFGIWVNDRKLRNDITIPLISCQFEAPILLIFNTLFVIRSETKQEAKKKKRKGFLHWQNVVSILVGLLNQRGLQNFCPDREF